MKTQKSQSAYQAAVKPLKQFHWIQLFCIAERFFLWGHVVVLIGGVIQSVSCSERFTPLTTVKGVPVHQMISLDFE
jgi:hypothetical protein